MMQNVVIVGAGPAGLTAGYELVRHGIRPLILEKGSRVGGLARTETYKGFRFDIGGHRFYTKVPEVEAIWHEVLGDDLLQRPRLSRIYYDGSFYNYPISLPNTLRNLGPLESARIFASYLKWQLFPHEVEENFEEWVTNRFGERLYRTFFKTYTEKVWGIPCHVIRADWAAQRIKDLSLKTAVSNALLGQNGVKSLIEEFHYPRLGPGMMWERMQALITRQGGDVQTGAEVMQIQHQGQRITQVVARQEDGVKEIPVESLISSMPLSHLVQRLDPAPPPKVLAAAEMLRYRDFLIVVLIVNQAQVFPDNWIYIHDPDVRVGRIQNFKNWSADMVPDAAKTSLGMEYFCSVGDDLWEMDDEALWRLARREIAWLGLAEETAVIDGTVIRQRKAYPVYDETYRKSVQEIADYLENFVNLQTIGRNGMHRYNNQDHSMLTGLLAARSIFGEKHNLWRVNTERSYYEEVVVGKDKVRSSSITKTRKPKRAAL